MYGLQRREELPEPVASEFDGLIARLKGFLSVSFNEDGTLRTNNVTSNSLAAADSVAPGDAFVPPGEEEGQWWRKGPWTLDDPTGPTPNIVGLYPAGIPAGTYNNYAPAGIDNSIVLEVNPEGVVSLTGLKPRAGSRKRLLLFRNRSATNSITLVHASAASAIGYRFDLPGGIDVECGAGQNILLYYAPDKAAWTAAVTPNLSGGLFGAGGGGGGGGELVMASLAFNLYTATTPQIVVAAQGVNTVILPVHWAVETITSVASAGAAPTVALRYAGLGTDAAGQLNTGANSIQTLFGVSGGSTVTAHTFGNVANKDLVVVGSQNVDAGWSGSVTVKVWYVMF